jgi:hypothetical protein
MNLLSSLASLLGFKISISRHDEKIVYLHKFDSYDLEICKPKLVRIERHFPHIDELHSFHLHYDDIIEHKVY